MDYDKINWLDANCKDAPSELFYPVVTEDDRPDDGLFADTVDFYAEGKVYCASCPLREQCLAYAVENRERYGLWGGLSPLERRRIDRRARRLRLRERRENETKQRQNHAYDDTLDASDFDFDE